MAGIKPEPPQGRWMKKTLALLRRYGWREDRDVVSGALDKALAAGCPLFPEGVRVIRQLEGLAFPGESSLIRMRFSTELIEGISHHVGERVISIGVERLLEVPWDPSLPPEELDYEDEVVLYLGQSGRVYWYSYDGECVGVAGESLPAFFARCFALIAWPEPRWQGSRLTAEDRRAMRRAPYEQKTG